MYNPDEECKIMITTLKKFCKQKNMTPHTLAKEAGISTSTISYLLNGRTKPQVYTILLLCNVLGVSIGELFDGKNSDISLGSCQTEIGIQYITSDEDMLLRYRRSLSDKKKELLRIFVEMLLQFDEESFGGWMNK